MIGYFIQVFGPSGFFILLAFVLMAMAAYAVYRMTQRPAPSVEDTSAYQTMMPTSTPVTVEVAQEWAIETAEADAEAEALASEEYDRPSAA